jgi:hypothetical protein
MDFHFKKPPKSAGASADWNILGGHNTKSLETNNSQLQMRSAHSMTVIFRGEPNSFWVSLVGNKTQTS